MATLLALTPDKTYANAANAIKAVNDKQFDDKLRYVIATNAEGRFFPIFLGEKAIQAGVHFHFCVGG